MLKASSAWTSRQASGDAAYETAKAASQQHGLKRQHQDNRDDCNDQCIFNDLGAVFLGNQLLEHAFSFMK
jgi:hypothetical protein